MNIDQVKITSGLNPLKTTATESDGLKQNTFLYMNPVSIHKHSVNIGYQILSKNDFEKVPNRVNVGYFNKKTDFLIGENKSLLFWDNLESKMVDISTSDALKEPKRYFIIYNMDFINKVHNNSIHIKNNTNSNSTTVTLDYDFGYSLGSFLFEEEEIEEDYLRAIIQGTSQKRKINKQVLGNSNSSFLCGILDGYIKDDSVIHVGKNVNLYNFIYILNFLGAQYTIRTTEPFGANQSTKTIAFRLPIQLNKISKLGSSFFRDCKYIMNNNKVRLNTNIRELPQLINNDFENQINSGLIEMIPLKDLVFLRKDNQIMYDYTMSDPDRNNFSLPLGPSMLNSDGDVLACISIFSKDAAQEATKAFGVDEKTAFQNLNTGKVQNHMIKLDAQLGLFNATK